MFDRLSVIIRDSSKLTYDYVPQVLPHREDQMKGLERLFRPMVTNGQPCSAFLYGGVGTGKTATAKRFCEDMTKYCASNSKQMDSLLINCRIKNTEHSALLQMVRHFDPGYPERGFSAEEMFRSFRAHIEKRSRPFVLILDEVDNLLKNNSENIIYKLTRINEDLKASSISIIMISQFSIADVLDEASMSTFKRANTIVFERYTAPFLRDILKQRIDEALLPDTVGEEELDLMTEIGSQFGDARFGIEIIEKSAMIAEEEETGRITADNIRTAGAMIYSGVSESKLKELDLNHKLALLAVSRALKGNAFVNINAAEKTYAIVCEEYGQAARKHTQFWSYIRDMERNGILATELRSEIETGRVTFITIPDIPPKELAKKLEYLLELPQLTDDVEW
ncbi:MAG: AAA family ATPase [Candidatus Methanomethylophilaceae archaeon]